MKIVWLILSIKHLLFHLLQMSPLIAFALSVLRHNCSSMFGFFILFSIICSTPYSFTFGLEKIDLFRVTLPYLKFSLTPIIFFSLFKKKIQIKKKKQKQNNVNFQFKHFFIGRDTREMMLDKQLSGSFLSIVYHIVKKKSLPTLPRNCRLKP